MSQIKMERKIKFFINLIANTILFFIRMAEIFSH